MYWLASHINRRHLSNKVFRTKKKSPKFSRIFLFRCPATASPLNIICQIMFEVCKSNELARFSIIVGKNQSFSCGHFCIAFIFMESILPKIRFQKTNVSIRKKTTRNWVHAQVIIELKMNQVHNNWQTFHTELTHREKYTVAENWVTCHHDKTVRSVLRRSEIEMFRWICCPQPHHHQHQQIFCTSSIFNPFN